MYNLQLLLIVGKRTCCDIILDIVTPSQMKQKADIKYHQKPNDTAVFMLRGSYSEC